VPPRVRHHGVVRGRRVHRHVRHAELRGCSRGRAEGDLQPYRGVGGAVPEEGLIGSTGVLTGVPDGRHQQQHCLTPHHHCTLCVYHVITRALFINNMLS